MAFPAHLFWKSNPNGHPSLTPGMLNTAQQKLGVLLPSEYITLLALQNGGFTHEFGYAMDSAPPIPVRELFGIVVDPQIKSAQNILETPNVAQEWGLPRGLVLLSGDERGWIALDYRHGTPPQVTWLQPNSAFQLCLAPSFADFVAGLRPLAELIGQDQ